MVNKLYKTALEVWEQSWDDFFDLFDQIPDQARAFMDGDKADAILEPLYKLSEEEQAVLDKARDKRYQRLMEELGLDGAAWASWTKEVEQDKYFPDYDKPDLRIKPAYLPKPPELIPYALMQETYSWDYPDTLEGLNTAYLVMYLFMADRINKYS